jgi:hypothetical protein
MVKDKVLGVLERINGAKIITIVLHETHKDGSNGFIDYVDERWGKARHRFAFVSYKDLVNNGHRTENVKSVLDYALKNNKRLDLVVERRQATPKQQFDWLIKIEESGFVG